jgi:hypothetical protein
MQLIITKMASYQANLKRTLAFVRGSIRKIPDWPLEQELQMVQLSATRCYFVSHSSEFCRPNPLCCFSSNYYYYYYYYYYYFVMTQSGKFWIHPLILIREVFKNFFVLNNVLMCILCAILDSQSVSQWTCDNIKTLRFFRVSRSEIPLLAWQFIIILCAYLYLLLREVTIGQELLSSRRFLWQKIN